jgi:hypothetical protein
MLGSLRWADGTDVEATTARVYDSQLWRAPIDADDDGLPVPRYPNPKLVREWLAEMSTGRVVEPVLHHEHRVLSTAHEDLCVPQAHKAVVAVRMRWEGVPMRTQQGDRWEATQGAGSC